MNCPHPVRPLDARDLVVVGLVPEDESANPELMEDAPGAAGDGAAPVDAGDGRVAGNLLDLFVGDRANLLGENVIFNEQ